MIFDLDDTLIETSKCLTPTYLKKAFDAMGVGDFEELQSIHKKTISSRFALQKFCEKLNVKTEILNKGLSALMAPLTEDLRIEPVEGALELLDDLKEHTLCLVTLGDPAFQRQKMEKAGIQEKRFSKLVVGKGLSKKFAYQEIMEEFPDKKVIVCGDRVPIDLSPAKELGLFTVHFKNGRGHIFDSPKEDVDVKIDTLKELKRFL